MKKMRPAPAAALMKDEPVTVAVYASEADRTVPDPRPRPSVTVLILDAASNVVTVTTAQKFYLSELDEHGESYFIYQPTDRLYDIAVGLSSVASISILGGTPGLLNEMPRGMGGII